MFAVFVYYAIKGMMRPTTASSGPPPAEILKERFARGEISAEEYREGRETLETKSSAPLSRKP